MALPPCRPQLLIAASLAGISSVAIIPFLYYQFILAAGLVVYILIVGAKR